MMGAFAVVALLPSTIPGQADFVGREFDTWPEFAESMAELERNVPAWRVVTVCHVEDLPLLMGESPVMGAAVTDADLAAGAPEPEGP